MSNDVQNTSFALLGNNNQSYNVVPKVQFACCEACMNQMKLNLNTTLAATEQERRFQVCADKGTAQKDCSRQAIVATHIGPEGFPCESLLSVDCIMDATTLGAAKHFTKHVFKVLDTKCIAVISTDGASTYTGKHRGMFQLLRSDSETYSDKLQYLPDLCHRAERLLGNNNPNWLEDVVEASDKIITKFNYSPQLRQAMLKHVCADKGVKLVAMQTTCETRYAE